MVSSTGCLQGGTDAVNGFELKLLFLLKIMCFLFFLLVPRFTLLDETMFYDIFKYRSVEVSNSHTCSGYSH